MVKTQDCGQVRIDLRAVVYRHHKWWIAHCLELDLVAEGTTPDKAIRDLFEISITQVETAAKTGNLETIFRAAPPEFWAMFSLSADARPIKKKLTSGSIERFEAREAVLA